MTVFLLSLAVISAVGSAISFLSGQATGLVFALLFALVAVALVAIALG